MSKPHGKYLPVSNHHLKRYRCDDRPDYEEKLQWTCDYIHLGFEVLYSELKEFPSIQMGLETAFLSLTSKVLATALTESTKKTKSSDTVVEVIYSMAPLPRIPLLLTLISLKYFGTFSSLFYGLVFYPLNGL